MDELSRDKRTAALRAALTLISEQGFHGTPMSQIAKTANIGMGTIYNYFPSKEDLINALYIDVKRRMAENIGGPELADAPVRDGFVLLLKRVVRFSVEHPDVLHFSEQYENSPLITPATRAESLGFTQPLVDLFRRGMQQKLLKNLPLETMAAMLSGAAISLAKLCVSNPALRNEDTLEAAVDAIWDLIAR